MNTINFREHTVAYPLQQWLHERSTMVRYTYIAKYCYWVHSYT